MRDPFDSSEQRLGWIRLWRISTAMLDEQCKIDLRNLTLVDFQNQFPNCSNKRSVIEPKLGWSK